MSNLAVQNTPFGEEPSSKASAAITTPSVDAKGAKKAQGAFRTISEVADELDVPQHVLRFWETKFTQVKPLKRGGGRRYYRPEDVALLKHIHHLLYTEGYTIKGAQKLLKGQGKNQIAAQQMASEEQAQPKVQVQAANAPQAAPQEQPSAKIYNLSDHQRSALEDMLSELKALRALIPQDAA